MLWGEYDMWRVGLSTCVMLSSACQSVAPINYSNGVQNNYSEALAGMQAAPALELGFGGIISDPIAEMKLSTIGAKLTESLPGLHGHLRLSLLASQGINAFSLPGPRVYLTRGLYDRISSKDNLLAAVIAHELAHLITKDSLRPRCRCTNSAIEREITADQRALELLRSAGYPPYAMIQLLDLIEDAQPSGWAKVRIDRLTQLLDSELLTPICPNKHTFELASFH